MFLIQEHALPQSLRLAVAAAANRVAALSEEQDWTGAFDVFDRLYHELLESQPQGRRYHKGYPLHNMGLAKLFLGEIDSAARLTLLAFIEDSLSRGEEAPRTIDEIGRPAAFNLIFAFSIPGPTVLGLARYVRELPQQGVIVADPEQLLQQHSVAQVLGLVHAPADIRLPGQFASPWERRVFIGGYYGDLPRLRRLRDLLSECGLDGVIAADFFRPPGISIRNHALMLLHECSAAAFDVTHRGDHSTEIDHLREYGIRGVRAIFDPSEPGAPHVGGMTRSNFEELGVEPVPVADDDLKAFADELCAATLPDLSLPGVSEP